MTSPQAQERAVQSALSACHGTAREYLARARHPARYRADENDRGTEARRSARAGSKGRCCAAACKKDQSHQAEGRCEAEVARQGEVEGIRGSRCRSERSMALS